MEAAISAIDPPSKSVRPVAPANSVSPETSTAARFRGFRTAARTEGRSNPSYAPGLDDLPLHIADMDDITVFHGAIDLAGAATPDVPTSRGCSISGASTFEAMTGAPVAARNSAAAST